MARFDPAVATVATAVNMSPGIVPGTNRLEHSICGKASQVLGHDPLVVMYLRDYIFGMITTREPLQGSESWGVWALTFYFPDVRFSSAYSSYDMAHFLKLCSGAHYCMYLEALQDAEMNWPDDNGARLAPSAGGIGRPQASWLEQLEHWKLAHSPSLNDIEWGAPTVKVQRGFNFNLRGQSWRIGPCSSSMFFFRENNCCSELDLIFLNSALATPCSTKPTSPRLARLQPANILFLSPDSLTHLDPLDLSGDRLRSQDKLRGGSLISLTRHHGYFDNLERPNSLSFSCRKVQNMSELDRSPL